MFANNLKIAFRNLLKNKIHTFINIFGLTIGIAVCFLIFLWVQDELVYDRFHAKADRIYRAVWEARFGDNEWKIPLVGVPLAEALEREFPEVEQTVRLFPGGMTLRHGDEFVREQSFLFVENSFFEVFTVHFISGNPQTALRDPNAVVLTAEAAQRYFPGENAVGQTIEQNDGTLMQVTAVVESFPSQSHMHFQFLAPLENLSRFERRRQQWGSASVYTYMVLRPGHSVDVLQSKLQKYIDENIAGETFSKSGNYTRYPFQPLLDIHLRSHLQTELEANGNITYVYLFSLIAVFILLLACINFVNLATARSMKRAREVGIRKVLGSQRAQLIRQFLAESFVYVALAVLGALILAELALPTFEQFTGKQLEISLIESPFALVLLAGLALVVTLLAGMYPAFFLSSFRPVQVLKGSAKTGFAGDRLRRDQLHYVQNKRIGFDKEHTLLIHRAGALGSQHVAFRDRLAANHQVIDATAAQNFPGQDFDSTVFQLEQPANYEYSSFSYAWVDEHYVDVLKLKMVAGRNFSTEFATDSSAFLINEAAAEAFGWDDPVRTGKQLTYGRFVEGPIIGVVENFHFESLHHEIKPIVLLLNRWQPSYIAVRLKPGNITDGIAAVRELWQRFVPNTPFAFSFLDQDYQQLYESEQRVARIFMVFSVLAIVIACLGLFALAAFAAEQRTKEIGVRKVLGATEASIVGLLSKEFAVYVLVAFIVSAPVAYFAMRAWLQNFAYRIDIGWGVFVLAGLLALVVALLTVSTQAIRAALTNPIEALRYE